MVAGVAVGATVAAGASAAANAGATAAGASTKPAAGAPAAAGAPVPAAHSGAITGAVALAAAAARTCFGKGCSSSWTRDIPSLLSWPGAQGCILGAAGWRECGEGEAGASFSLKHAAKVEPSSREKDRDRARADHRCIGRQEGPAAAAEAPAAAASALAPAKVGTAVALGVGEAGAVQGHEQASEDGAGDGSGNAGTAGRGSTLGISKAGAIADRSVWLAVGGACS